MNERIKLLRKTLKLSQDEFAKRLGITGSGLSNIENGKRALTEQMTLAICREFDVNEGYFRNGDGEMFIQLSRDDEIKAFTNKLLQKESGDFKRRFIGILSKLDESGWEAFERVALEFSKSLNGTKENDEESYHLIYRAARSDNNHEATIELRSAKDLDKLESAPTVDSDDDL